MPPRVLFVSSECAPWSKTGGLADVSASLPAALRKIGVDIRVLTPRYASMRGIGAGEGIAIPAAGLLPPARVLEAELPDGVPALVLDCPALYDRPGGPYQDAQGRDWPDNALRFAQLSRAAAHLASAAVAGWKPQVIHGNDWQGALAPVYVSYGDGRAASVVTIHNLAFQGVFPASVVGEIGLPPESFDGTLEYYGKCSFLKGGLVCGDAITTVSPTYAREIQDDATGMGLAGVLRERARDLHGILNGIDTDVWNPATDPHLAATYDAGSLDRKRDNKWALHAACGWPADDAPLFGLVGRLTDQKGIDLVLAAAPALEALGARLVILGAGDPKLEAAIAALASARPTFAQARIGFDEGLAHRIEAGADFFLMPSRFEPCGMNQMYSQRYGTPPIVRATGGLIDSVTPYDAKSGGGTGFSFVDATPGALIGAMEQAVGVYREGERYRAVQVAGMGRDFSWAASAARFRDLYASLI
jgi:starch synthase